MIEVLAAIPDVRDRHGRRHPLVARLAMACTAMLCGYRSYRAMAVTDALAEWGRHSDRSLVTALGFTHTPTPCAATFLLLVRRLAHARFEAVLGGWAEAVLAATGTATEADALALDGTTLRGSRKQGAPGAHLLSAVSHRLGVTTGQLAVDDTTNESGAVSALLRGLVLEGRVVTMDALLTQRTIAQTIVDRGGDYVLLVKGNQPQRHADRAAEFASPVASAPRPAAIRHGRPRGRTTAATVVLQSGR